MTKIEKKVEKKSVLQSETLYYITTMYSMSWLFWQSSLNTVPSTVYLSSFEVCALLALIPYPIFLFPVICFKLPITRTPSNSNFFLFPLVEGSSYWETLKVTRVNLITWKWSEGKQKLLQDDGRFDLLRVWVTEGKIIEIVWRKSKGNRF